MKKFAISLLFSLAVFISFSQTTYEKTYGSSEFSETGYSVCQTNDNGYIVTGSYGLIGDDKDVWLIKISQNGDSLWSKTFGGDRNDVGNSVKQCNDNGFIIAGYKNDLELFDRDLYLIKTDENGNEEWSKVYGVEDVDEGANSVCQTNDNGYIVAGYIGTGVGGFGDVYLLKTDENGDTLWTKRIGGDEIDVAEDIQQTKDNGYIIAGHTHSFGSGNTDVWLIKTNENGDTLWTRTYGGQDNDGGNSIDQTIDNGYVITGSTRSFGDGSADIYLIKTNHQGDTLWTKVISGRGSDAGKSIQQTYDNGFIITGHTQQTGDFNFDMWLIKIDNSGILLWDRLFSGDNSSISTRGYCVSQTEDNGYIVCGENVSGLDADLYMVKTDENGSLYIDANTLHISREVKIHPNPTDEDCRVEIGIGDESLEIIDLNGQTIHYEKFDPITGHIYKQIDLSHLPTGIYLIKIKGGKKIRNGKLILL